MRLLNLLSAIRELSPFSELSADEELLLRDLLLRWHEDVVLTVSDIMQRPGRASSSTLYRRVMALKDKGLISLRVDDTDKRVRFVEPTSKATAYMNILNQGLEEIDSGHGFS